MTIVFILVTVAVILGLAFVLWRQGHPEDTASHQEDVTTDSSSDRFYRGVDRPAGPDAEATGVMDAGQPAPDPDIVQERNRPGG